MRVPPTRRRASAAVPPGRHDASFASASELGESLSSSASSLPPAALCSSGSDIGIFSSRGSLSGIDDGGEGGGGGGDPTATARSRRLDRMRTRGQRRRRLRHGGGIVNARRMARVILASFGLIGCALIGMTAVLSLSGAENGVKREPKGADPTMETDTVSSVDGVEDNTDTDTLEGVVDGREKPWWEQKGRSDSERRSGDARDAERRKDADQGARNAVDGNPKPPGRLRRNKQPAVDRAAAVEPNALGLSEDDVRGFRTRLQGAPPCDKLEPEDISYTLVTQLSHDRIWMMAQHCARWGNDAPISVVVYTDETREQLTDELVGLGCDRRTLIIQTLPTTSFGQSEYPVNVMRNMALSRVRTTHVMYADVDFWESTNLLEVLNMQSVRKELAADHKLAAVVPAFMVKRQCMEYKDCREENLVKMPNTTQQMIDLVMGKQAGAFDPTNRGGHGSTSYGAWYAQQEGELFDVPCFKSNRYEPYLAFRFCEDLPPFQEQFMGYGKNKMTWVMQLRRAGYDFTQLGRVFLVHYPHLDSKARLEWNKGPNEIFKPVEEGKETRRKKPGEVKDVDWDTFVRGRVDRLYIDFRDWLNKDVPDKSRVFLCEDVNDDDEMLWVNNKGESEESS